MIANVISMIKYVNNTLLIRLWKYKQEMKKMGIHAFSVHQAI